MPGSTSNIPLLIVPHADPVGGLSLTPRSLQFAQGGTGVKRILGPVPIFQRPLSQAEWAWLATEYPNLFQDFMQFPHNPDVVGELGRRVVIASPINQRTLSAEVLLVEEYVDLTTMPSNALTRFFDRARSAARSILHVVFQPASGRYRVEWQRTPPDLADAAADRLLSGAWRYSSVGEGGASAEMLRRILTGREVVDTVEKGARIVLVPGEAMLTSLRLVAMSMGDEGVPQFRFPEAKIKAMGGIPRIDIDRLPGPLSEPAFQPMAERLRKAVAVGRQPVVFFDIDDTLVIASPRAKKVLENFLEGWVKKNPGKEWVLDLVQGFTPSQVEYGIRETLVQAGLDNLGIEDGFEEYFNKHFLSDELLWHDAVRPGALELVLALKSLGVRIVYLTGRTADDMKEGTVKALRAAGFPVNEPGVELVMREDHAEPDVVFKARVMGSHVGPGDLLVGAFDNEPGILVNMRRSFPDAPLYLVGNRHSPNAPEPPDDAIPIANFGGKIGRTPRRAKPTVGESARGRGRKMARQLPEDVQSKISYVPPGKKANPDVVVWNIPPRQIPLQNLANEVSLGGVVVVQSESSGEQYQQGLGGDASWGMIGEVSLKPNDYVLPSAFLSAGNISPLFFQVWQAR